MPARTKKSVRNLIDEAARAKQAYAIALKNWCEVQNKLMEVCPEGGTGNEFTCIADPFVVVDRNRQDRHTAMIEYRFEPK